MSQTVMHQFWYDYAKPNYWENAKLCYMEVVCDMGVFENFSPCDIFWFGGIETFWVQNL